MGGKGVKVSGEHLKTIEEGEYAQTSIISASLEENLLAKNFLMSFVDGTHVVDMPPIQDHKRAEEDTIRIRAVWEPIRCKSSAAVLTQKISMMLTKLPLKLPRHSQRNRTYFKGIMYGGFIAVKNGVRLIEYNARFGDPSQRTRSHLNRFSGSVRRVLRARSTA